MFEKVMKIVDRLSIKLFGIIFLVRVDYDQKDGFSSPATTGTEPRVFIQMVFHALDTKDNIGKQWRGRKWYLSEHDTDTQILNTIYLAFEVAVKHEVMESFKVDGKTLYNPHYDFEALLKVTEESVRT